MVDVLESAAPPDWEVIEEEILCPLCDYNLRGLVKPRCPECGYRFDWPELLDPSLRRHPYLFEHHPERNFRSFWQTLFGTLRPRRFWSSLHPAQPSRPRRLLGYYAIVVGLIIMPCLIAVFATLAVSQANLNRRMHQYYTGYATTPQGAWFVENAKRDYGSVQALLDDTYPAPPSWPFVRDLFLASGRALREASPFLLTCVGWPLLTFGALMVFQMSMRRAKVNPRHVLRCTIYCFDVALWATVIGLLGGGLLSRAPVAGFAAFRLSAAGAFVLGVTVLSLLTMIYRLWIAYRQYLRFDHPASTVVASQVIAGLVAANLLVALTWLG